MATERIDITGADCSWCLNESLDAVRALEGVSSVRSSISGGCVEVEHDLAEVAPVLEVLRRGLRGSDLSTNEAQLVAVEPSVQRGCCSHTAAHGGTV